RVVITSSKGSSIPVSPSFQQGRFDANYSPRSRIATDVGFWHIASVRCGAALRLDSEVKRTCLGRVRMAGHDPYETSATFQKTDFAIPRHLFADVLRLIAELRPPPDPEAA